MPRSLLDTDGFRPQFAGHATFPLRHGWLKRAFDAVSSGDTSPFHAEDAIASFGVGKNMVDSIRHWSLACDVIVPSEPSKKQMAFSTTEFSRIVFSPNGDPYCEHPGTIWLLHWNIAAFPGRSTVWYWLFNEYHEPDFEREHLRHRLRAALDAAGLGERAASPVTVQRDLDCVLRCYAPRPPTKRMREEHVECPLADLSLLATTRGRDGYAFQRGPKRSLPDEVLLHATLGFWTRLYPTRRTVSLEALTHEPGSPGRVFQLDQESLAAGLGHLTRLTRGSVRYEEAGGLQQVSCIEPAAIPSFSLIAAMYKRELHGVREAA